MSNVSELSLAVLRRFAEFLERLPEDQITDLAEGRAQLSYIPWVATEPVLPKPAAKPAKFSAATILAALKAASSREEGEKLLAPLTVQNLRAIAKLANLTGVSKTPQEELTDMLIRLTIGGRLSFAAMSDL